MTLPFRKTWALQWAGVAGADPETPSMELQVSCQDGLGCLLGVSMSHISRVALGPCCQAQAQIGHGVAERSKNARDPRRVEGLADDDPGWMDGSRCRWWCYWFLDCSQMARQSHPPESNKAPLSLPLCLLCRVIVLPVLYITKVDSL